jgi:hypothetical protein
MIGISWGYDIHRLHPGSRTVLSGVEFPDFSSGFDTHSDGDVVAYALIAAAAGALGIGSLGDYFTEDDPADDDARSIEFLSRCRPVINREGATIVNLDWSRCWQSRSDRGRRAVVDGDGYLRIRREAGRPRCPPAAALPQPRPSGPFRCRRRCRADCVTRDSAIRPIRRPWRRSSRSCARPGTGATDADCVV